MLKWTREETLSLIKIYKRKTVLYDFRNKNYRIQAFKEKAFSEILHEMNKLKPAITIIQIRRKLKRLREEYSKHLRDPYRREPIWFIGYMSFLEPFMKRGGLKIESNLKEDDTHTDDTVNLVSESENDDDADADADADADDERTMIKTEIDSTEVEVEPDINTNSSLNENNYQLPHEQFRLNKRRNSEYYEQNYEESSFPKRGKVENFAEEQTTAESLSEGTGRDEELFCNFLCQNLKKIRSNDEYEDVQWKILDLVKLAIRKEKILQAYSQSGNSNGPSQFTYHYN